MENRLYRSRNDRMLFGVCGGLAKYFGIDSSLMRIIVVLLALATGIGVLVYFIMAFVVPLEGSTKTNPKEIVLENVEEVKTTAKEFGQDVKGTVTAEKATSEEDIQAQARRRNTFGIFLIILGVFFLMATFGLIRWPAWSVIWPLALILLGVAIIISVTRKK